MHFVNRQSGIALITTLLLLSLMVLLVYLLSAMTVLHQQAVTQNQVAVEELDVASQLLEGIIEARGSMEPANDLLSDAEFRSMTGWEQHGVLAQSKNYRGRYVTEIMFYYPCVKLHGQKNSGVVIKRHTSMLLSEDQQSVDVVLQKIVAYPTHSVTPCKEVNYLNHSELDWRRIF